MMKVEGDDMESLISLLPPEVLEQLLGFLSVASLRTIRLMNPNCAKASIVPMRKKSGTISFGFPAGLNSPFSYTHEDLERFLACFEASKGNFPVSKYQMTLSPFDNSTFKDDKILDSFFMAVSPTVTELTLSFSLGRCRPKNWPGNHQYPKLTSLRLKVEFYPRCSNNPRIYPEETFDFVEGIIGQAPKLEMVSLEFGKRILGAVGLILEAISGREVLLKQIAYLRLNMLQMMETEFSKLDSVHGLKLEVLKLISGRQGYNNDMVQPFLKSQADSLRTLEIERHEIVRNGGYEIIQIPALKKLEYLKIAKDILTDPILSSENFPALRRVHFESPEFPHVIFAMEPLGSVEELNISGVTDNNGNGIFGILRISSIFPNVTKLGIIPASRKVVLAVYESFPNLVELQLNLYGLEGDEDADSILTGFSKPQLKALEAEMEANGNLNEVYWHRQVYASKSESIASLQHLKILTLRPVWAGAVPLEFGLVSSYVLKSMESLKFLHLGTRRFPPSDKRTQSVLQDLRQKICVVFNDPRSK